MQAIKCELCGSTQLIKENGYYQCEHCGTKYTLEEARKLIVSGTVEVVTGNAEKERLLKNAETCIKLGEFDKAKKFYEKIINDFPTDYRGWWGKYSIPFRRYINGENNPEDYGNEILNSDKLFFNAFNLCDDKSEFLSLFKQVINRHGNTLQLSKLKCYYYDIKNKTHAECYGASCFTSWIVFESEEIFKILRSDDLLFFRNSIVQQYVNDVKSGKIAPIRQIGAYSTMWQFYSEEPYHNAWNKDKILKTYKGNTNYFELLFMNYGFKIENQNYGNVSISNKDVSFPLYSTDGIPEFEIIAIIGRWAYIAFRYYDSVSRE